MSGVVFHALSWGSKNTARGVTSKGALGGWDSMPPTTIGASIIVTTEVGEENLVFEE